MQDKNESISLIQLESMIHYAKSRPSYEYAKPIEDFLYWQYREKGTPEIFAMIDSISQHFKEQNEEVTAERIARLVMRRMHPQVEVDNIDVTDEQIANAIMKVMTLFSVGTQWVAIYRILVDFCSFPKEITDFCDKIDTLGLPRDISFPCDYQAIQKPMGGIFAMPYVNWLKYRPAEGDKMFKRQKKVADTLYQLLKEAEKEMLL
jgi:hypothetical protein